MWFDPFWILRDPERIKVAAIAGGVMLVIMMGIGFLVTRK